MRTDAIAPIIKPPAISPDGVLFLYSPNLALRIRYGSLLVDLGRGRSLKVDRASEPRLRRLVIAGHGWWSFEVATWCHAIGAAWMHLDLVGNILGSGPGDISPDLPALRRQQALAGLTQTGIRIGRELLTHKIASQAAALSLVPGTDEGRRQVADHVALLAACTRADELRSVEARAAAAFWAALADVPVAFTAADQAKVPESWLSIGRRSSVLTGSPRGAATPAQAVWNFAYSCAAAEVECALRATGLDPGISATGLHADTGNRSGATWDVLEAIRGDVDRLMLTTIQDRRFRRRDFAQRPDGRVRLTASLARELAEAVLPLARQAVAPVAEQLARTLAEADPRIPEPATNLTGEARRAGNGKARQRPDTSRRIARSLLPPACRRCGVMFEEPADRGRKVCEECGPVAAAERNARLSAAGPEALAAIARREGRYPVQRAEVRERIGRSQSERRLADLAWEADHPEGADAAAFDELVPALRGLPLRAIAEATGLSLTAARAIRSGKAPHPRHWEALSIRLSAARASAKVTASPS
jgi:hypothetical protein